VDEDTTRGPQGGEPFPSFDPEFPPRSRTPRPRGSGPRRPPKEQPNPWLVGLALAVVLATVSVIAFGLLNGGDDGGTAATTTATTAPGGTTETTAPGGSTSSTTTDGTAPTITLPGGGTVTGPIEAVGSPIPISELQMSSDDIGPLDFGADGDEVLGRLVSTFGQPSGDTGFFVGDGTFGECPGWGIRVVRWGPLNIVLHGEPGDSSFVSYRLDVRYGGAGTLPMDIATLSGLRVYETVAELESTYSSFFVDFVVEEDVGLTFQVKLSQNEAVLLWGPVDSTAQDALITGIYSPDACDTTATTTPTTVP